MLQKKTDFSQGVLMKVNLCERASKLIQKH